MVPNRVACNAPDRVHAARCAGNWSVFRAARPPAIRHHGFAGDVRADVPG